MVKSTVALGAPKPLVPEVCEMAAVATTTVDEAPLLAGTRRDRDGVVRLSPGLQEFDAVHQRRFQRVVQTAMALVSWPMSDLQMGTMLRLLKEAYRAHDEVYTAEDAVRAADGFRIPETLVAQDSADFLAVDGDLERLMFDRREAVADRRMSRERILRCISADNPERDKLLELASAGIPIHYPRNLRDPFTPNGTKPSTWKLTSGFQKAGAAVEKSFFETFCVTGLTLVLPAAMAMRIPGLHVSTANWAPKTGKVEGRPTMNPSAFNGNWAKELCDKQWGAVRHPTIELIVAMIMAFVAAGNAWEDIVLWKMDIKGAYTLLTFRLDHIQRMAVRLQNELLMIFGCGGFGYTGLPAAFDVVTRAIRWELKRLLRGVASMYVDDIIGACLARDVHHDMGAAEQLCTQLLGEGSIAQHKSVFGRRIEVIGYILDLDLRTVSIGDRCVKRAFHGYMEVDEEGPVPVRVMQRLASWAERYSLVCTLIAPFQASLYRSYTGFAEQCSIKVLRPAAKRSIRLIRCLLMMTVVQEIHFSRPFHDLVPTMPPACIVAEFDASLTGAGILWYWRRPNGSERLLGGVALDFRSFDFKGQPTYQNCAEFIAVVCAVRGVIKMRELGVLDSELTSSQRTYVSLRGDSVSALTWASKQKFRSELVCHAAMFFVMQCVAKQVVITGHEHLPAEFNTATDRLSRREVGETYEMMGRSHPRLQGLEVWDPEVEQVLPLCDPRREVDSEGGFLEFWREIQRVLEGGWRK